MRRRLALTCALLSIAALAAAAPAFAGAAVTREPLSLYRAELRDPAAAPRSGGAPRALAVTSVASDAGAPQISSSQYGPDTTDAILAAVEALPHGPEIASLSIYVATPEEIESICGTSILACYFPAQSEMVVSGEDRTVDGVSREEAIAHEYGHHIAATRLGSGPLEPLRSGTLRWATYERVCQLTRAGRLFPGDQGAHYWQDPEEAFAETYADLVDPAGADDWEYSPLLAPSPASLAKVRADLEHPWAGPVTRALSGELAAPPRPGADRGAGSGREALAGATALGTSPSVAVRRLRTPLDGRVEVVLTAPPSAAVAFSLRDPKSGRVLARGRAEAGQSSEISYGNCGRDDLSLEARSLDGAGTFEAIVRRP